MIADSFDLRPTRRDLFRGAALTAGGLCLRYAAPAAANLEPFSFFIASDTHLGRRDSQAPEHQWRQALDEMQSRPGDFILHLGDIVDQGRVAQYAIFQDSLATAGKPCYAIPGNHDELPAFRQYVRQEVDTAIDHRGVRLLLLNNARRDSHLGFLEADQLRWLAVQLEEAAARRFKVIIACHVPLHSNRHPDRGWHVKPEAGQGECYQLLDRHTGSVIALFHGHFHNGLRGWQDRGRLVEVLFPSTCYNQDRSLAQAIQAGQASGFFVPELRPGYVQVTLGRGQLAMRYKPLGAPLHGEHLVSWES
jgi:3',5'-cyclic AMP phosphodiesterase CpdA